MGLYSFVVRPEKEIIPIFTMGYNRQENQSLKNGKKIVKIADLAVISADSCHRKSRTFPVLIGELQWFFPGLTALLHRHGKDMFQD